MSEYYKDVRYYVILFAPVAWLFWLRATGVPESIIIAIAVVWGIYSSSVYRWFMKAR